MVIDFVYREVDKSYAFENRVKDDFKSKVECLSIPITFTKVEIMRDGNNQFVVVLDSNVSKGDNIVVSKKHESVVGAYELALNIYMRKLRKYKTKVSRYRKKKAHTKEVLRKESLNKLKNESYDNGID